MKSIYLVLYSSIYKLIHNYKKTREKTREKIFYLIEYNKYNKYITIQELSTELNISVKGIEWQISKLKTEGKIRRVGPDKGGYWEIIKNGDS